MERQRFEELTRGLAMARSRREMLKLLLGGIFAGGAIAAQRGGAAAQDPCTEDEDCAEGEICCAGFCRAIECCIDEEDPNARCAEGTSCFEGLCVPLEVACESDEGCAEGEICCAGFCRAIECCIDEADPNARCPEGTSCFEGYCDPIEIYCDNDTQCEAGEICCANVCRAIECCIDEADPNARCAEGTTCYEGQCVPVDTNTPPQEQPQAPVVALPSTGAGTSASNSPSVWSAILAGSAAAAAALGVRMRRQAVDEPPRE